MKEKEFLKKMLLREVGPATGCTEVGAVALATAWAVKALGGPAEEVEEIHIEVDESTYKNSFGVGVPGTGETGLGFAAAMGAVSSRRVEQGLQILESPEKESVEKAHRLIFENRVKIVRVSDSKDILIRSLVRNLKDRALALIQGSHDHLVGVERNGKPFRGAPTSDEDSWKRSEEIRGVRYESLIAFAREVDLDDLPILREAVRMNMCFAAEARKSLPSLQIGQVMEKYGGKKEAAESLSRKSQFVTTLAVEARMKGLDLPVMACAGSGNQGLVATIPVVETAGRLEAPEERLLRALALSFLTTIYIKSFTGLLSPICGCGVAAAVGAGCGIVFLMGGGVSQIEAQINNMIGAMAGIICDGAKSGCSLKALMAVGLAVDSSYLSPEDVRIPSRDGIMGKNVTETLKHLQQIIETGMPSMDTAVVRIMEKKGNA